MTEESESILRPLKTANPQVVTWEFAQQCRVAAELIEEFATHLKASTPFEKLPPRTQYLVEKLT